MPAVLFARDGKGDKHISRPHPVDMATAFEKISQFPVQQFSTSAPTINGHLPFSPDSPWKHVILKIEENETNQRFDKAGYYLIGGLQPGVCAGWFGIVFY